MHAAGETRSIFSGYTRLSKLISFLLVAGYAIQLLVPSARQQLALVPGRTLPYAWNLVTSSLLEQNVAQLVCDVLALLLLARAVEPVLGSKEFLKLLLLVDVLIGCSTLIVFYIVFYITLDGDLLYMEVSGFHGIVAALLVAVKHIMPDHSLKLFRVIDLKASNLPSAYVVMSCIACFVLPPLRVLPFVLAGTYWSWLYLRFFQFKAEANTFGDPSDDFKFSSFFPWFVAPVVDAVAAACSMVTRLSHTQHASRDTLPYAAVPVAPLPGSNEAESSRRRERGARSLQERLGAASTSSSGGGGAGSSKTAASASNAADLEKGLPVSRHAANADGLSPKA